MSTQLAKNKVYNAAFLFTAIASLYYIDTLNYLIFHTFAEIISVGISLSIFTVMYNAYDITSNNYLKVIGIAYFFIAILDVLHTLSYQGMILFVQGHYYANQLWIATRFFEATVMIFGFYFVSKKKPTTIDKRLLISLYSVITLIIILTIFYWNVFPACYIDGVGQTKFKIYSEYVISLIFIVNLILLINKKEYFSKKVYRYLILSFIFYTLTELTFTVYVSNYGFLNMLGHYLKLCAFYFSYRALVETSIKEPYNTIFNELNKKNEHLEESNKTKDRLFSIIGHDLRSPLAGIGSLLDLLSMEIEEKDCSKTKEYTTLMKKSTNITIDLLDNLLNWSRSQNNSLLVQRESFLINQLIQDNLSFFNTICRQKNIEMIFNIQNETDLLVIADKIMINTVLRNLINNAIKFTPRGGKITISTKQSGEYVEVSVSDTGIGIKDEDQARLFNFTTNTSTFGTEGEKGTGLGLVLSRDFVKKNGGSIWVESKCGLGAAFYFTLKYGGMSAKLSHTNKSIKPDSSINSIQDTSFKESFSIYKPKILVAEDDLVNRKIIKKFFEKNSLPSDVAADGEEALKLFNKNAYDIIFMDCIMPLKDGYEVTSVIRSIEGDKKHTIIIAMTASAMDGDKERCLKAGMDDYISKPFKFEELMNMLKKYGGYINSDDTRITYTDCFIRTVTALMEESNLDKETCVELLDNFCEHAQELIHRIEENINDNDFEKTHILLHQLKGSSGNVRAKKISQLSFAAEEALKTSDKEKLKSILKEIQWALYDLVGKDEIK